MTARKMHADEADIDVELVRRLIGAQFPQWTRLPIVRFDSGGTVNAIYRLGDDMYVRLPLLDTYARSLAREATWLPKLGPHLPLTTPEVMAQGVPGEGYPFDWAVYRWLDGETWNDSRVRDLREAATDIADFIGALWRIDTTGVRPPRGALGAPLAAYDGWVRGSIDAARSLIDARLLTAAWEEALTAPEFDGPRVWVHSDLLRGNVLVASGRVSAVIDFGGVHIGDPARDLIAAWTLFSAEGRAAFRDAVDADEGTWARARGWAIRHVGAIPYYRDTNPAMLASGLHTIREVLADRA